MAIGVVMMLFLISLLASSVTEIISRWLKKRSGHLEAALVRMVGEQENRPSIAATRSFRAMRSANGRELSHLSAKAFADSVIEYLAKAKAGASDAAELFAALPVELQQRLRPMLVQVGGDLTAIRSELEGWFDDTMDRVEAAYKRWAQVVLFFAGLTIAVLANASVYGLAWNLWQDPLTTQAVSQAASSLVENGGGDAPADFKELAAEVDGLDETALPIGWNVDLSGLDDIVDAVKAQPGGWFGSIGGWLATALLVMLGAPFWFDLLTKLVNLRGGGAKPPRAPDDPASASFELLNASGRWTVPGSPKTPEQELFEALGDVGTMS